MISVMVVDDEPLARQELERLVQAISGFQVVEKASNGLDALEKLKKNPVDILFMDIQMPALDGLQTASRLSEWKNPPLIIFATSYDKHALEAFEKNAIDYILKPYDPARIEKALKKATDFLKSRESFQSSLVSLDKELIQKGMVKKLAGQKKNTRDRIVIDPADVLYFYVEYSEIRAVTSQDEVMLNATLKELLQQLDGKFAQTHKSYVVNLDQVVKVMPMFSGNFELILKDAKGTKVPLSRRYAKVLKPQIGGW